MLRGKNGLNFLIEVDTFLLLPLPFSLPYRFLFGQLCQAAKQRPTLVGVPPLAIWYPSYYSQSNVFLLLLLLFFFIFCLGGEVSAVQQNFGCEGISPTNLLGLVELGHWVYMDIQSMLFCSAGR